MEAKRIADEAKNGVVETYYENGKLKSRANYKDGERNGLREEWYENGKPWERSTCTEPPMFYEPLLTVCSLLLMI